MTFSPGLEARFADLLTHYPEGRQRGALIPMLMYAQDEVGAITPDLMAELAARLGISVLQVDEVVGYYSMLHKKPQGKYHVQVCTNVACMLLGGAELYDSHCAACHGTLGIGDGEEGEELTTAPADLVISLADKSHRDNFFYWTIAEGGAQFDSDMPAFSEDLNERQIWKIVVFLRAAFDDSIEDPTTQP